MAENKLLANKHALIWFDNKTKDFNMLERNFCGQILKIYEDIKLLHKDAILYLAGDIGRLMLHPLVLNWRRRIIIGELSTNFNQDDCIASIGQVPLNIHNVGLFFPKLFPQNMQMFEKITKEHQLQDLTLGDKQGKAYRTGIYLTKIEEEKNQLNFKLLRCSSNFTGPTDNFRETDDLILTEINSIANRFFEKNIDCNHVLAQVYHNQTIVDENGISRDKKAVIAEHSDKTEDMPSNGLIVFTTFLKDFFNIKTVKPSKTDRYDFVYKEQSVLTNLVFRLKKPNPHMISRFKIILYPGSVFMIPLSMNREYTHTIVPSILPVEHLPIRMGYVIRCAKTKAVYKDDKTFIEDPDGNLVALKKPNKEQITNLKELYAKENLTNEVVEYPPFLDFTLNSGDFQKPLL